MILDPNGMPILQPTIDNAETATFNDAFAAIGNAVVAVENAVAAVENVRQIQTYKWADNAARTAQTGMTAGDEGYQTDTDTTYIYSGSVWRAVLEDTGWIALILLNSWVNFGGGVYADAQYRRLNGITYLQGVIKDGSTSRATSVGEIPVGFRPLKQQMFPVASTADNSNIEATTDGNLLLVTTATSYISLSGLSWVAGE